mmetsp:Transcript_504/g.1079  ORF Transcript_504/g.1079 Transcript_504/m.1079 type:complete len:228 (+) Transcript_504:229-912(+)
MSASTRGSTSWGDVSPRRQLRSPPCVPDHSCRRSESWRDRMRAWNSLKSMTPFLSRSAMAIIVSSSESFNDTPMSPIAAASSSRLMAPVPPELMSSNALRSTSAVLARGAVRRTSLERASRAWTQTLRTNSRFSHRDRPSSFRDSGRADLPRSHGGSVPATPGSMQEALTHSHRLARSWKLPSWLPRTTGPSEKSPVAITLMGWTASLALNTSQSTGRISCMSVFMG